MSEYNFLGLVNDVNGRLNEVALTDQNFYTASGWYSQAKEAVNSAIMHISQKNDKWPFYFQTTTMALTPSQIKYSYPDGAESIKMDSFRLIKSASLNNDTTYLTEGDYEQALKDSLDVDSGDYNVGIPSTVFRYPDLSFGVYPAPSSAFNLKYEWYKLPATLDQYNDVPDIPYQWRHIIVNGAMMYAYMFRGDPDSSSLMQTIFEDNIKYMKRVYENRYVSVRDTRVRR